MVAVLNKDASKPIKVIGPNADLIATLMTPALDSREAHLETVQHAIASRSIGGDNEHSELREVV
jgi:hypothetical protein